MREKFKDQVRSIYPIRNKKKIFWVFFIATIIVLPVVFYTFKLTNRLELDNTRATSKKPPVAKYYYFKVTKNSKSVSEAAEGTKLSIKIHSKVKRPLKDVRIAFDGVWRKPSVTKFKKRGDITIIKVTACCNRETHNIKIKATDYKGKRVYIKHQNGRITMNFKVKPFSNIAEVSNVKNFGAIGDGVADDTDALQRAIDSTRGILEVPPGNYKISKPLFMKSYVRLKGEPGKSSIIQTATDEASPFVIVMGDAFPSAFDSRRPQREQFTNFPTQENSWLKGSKTISLQNSEDTKKLSPGEVICVRSTKKFDNDNGYTQPDYVQFNLIKKINGNKLILADKAINTIGDESKGPPQVCKITGRNPYLSYLMGKDMNWYAAKWAEVSGITIRGGRLGFGGGLCYDCYINKIKFIGTDMPLVLNTMLNSRFEDLSGEYSTEAIEIAMSSTNNLYRNMSFTYRPLSCSVESQPNPTNCPPPEASTKRPANCSEATYPDPKDCPLNGTPAVAVGERSANITFDNIDINVGYNATLPARLISFRDAQNIKFLNSELKINGAGNQQVFELSGNIDSAGSPDDSKSDFSTENYVIANNRINLGVQKNELAIIVGNMKNWIQNLRFYNNRWTGTRTTNGAAYWAGNYVKDWSVKDEYIPIATHFRIPRDETHLVEDPEIQNVIFGN